jgi:hypothetical protein
LSRREAEEGITIPFRFQLGPRLVRESIDIPPGARRGDKLTYEMFVSADIRLDIVVHVDVE